MDTDTLERLALSDDRDAALAALLPGTPEHDYWLGIQHQHAGRLDAADALLIDWWKRHRGTDEHYARLIRRQYVLRAASQPERVSDDLRRECGVTLNDQAEVEVDARRLPTRLDDDALAAFVRDATAASADLTAMTEASLSALVDSGDALDVSRLRQLLAGLSRSNLPALVSLIARDLAAPHAPAFGAVAIHRQLTLAQLIELAGRLPSLTQQPAWVDAVMARLVPPDHIDTRNDLAERALWLDHLWAFVRELDPTFNTLKSQVLYHRLDLDRRTGAWDRARLIDYLALPRQTHYASPTRLQLIPSVRVVRQAANIAPSAGLDPVYDDEPLVTEALSHFLQHEDATAFAEFLRADWLDALLATTRLLAGAPDTERWSSVLGPTRLASLHDRVELDLTARNPARLAADAPVVLEVDVKNITALVVKVFRINVVAYVQSSGVEPDTAIDLDGLIASSERTLTLDAPPLRRTRLRLEVPEVDRAGTWVVELIGSGRSSRALVRKGALRHTVRVGVGGPVVSVYDDDGRPLDDARIWLGGREYSARDDGGITLPFSTALGTTPLLLVHGDVAQREVLDHPAETYAFAAGIHLERESVVAGRSARVLLRPLLTLAGRPATAEVLEEPRVELSLTDHQGVTSTRTEPVTLRDDAETVFEPFIPDGAASVSVQLRARVRSVSTQQSTEHAAGASAQVNAIHAGLETVSLYLAATADGHVLSVLGKNGEPVVRRALTVTLRHAAVTRDFVDSLETDAAGQVALGPLADVLWITATLATGQSSHWTLCPERAMPAAVHCLAGAELALPAPLGVSPDALMRSLSLTEMRADAPRRDATAHVALDGHALVVTHLEPGRYVLRGAGLAGPVAIVVVPSKSEVAGRWATSGPVMTELSPAIPVVRALAADPETLTARLSGVGPQTRVHVVATRYLPCQRPFATLAAPPRTPQRVSVPAVLSHYASGRDIGEEYRYVLDRRTAARRPGVLLDKPGLLLNPWALRTTATTVQHAALGGAYAPSPQRAAWQGVSAEAAADAFGAEAGDPVSFDHHASASVVLANLRPDADGVLRVPRATLGDAQRVEVIVVDPALTSSAVLALAPRASAPRDLRLKLALDPAAHFYEDRRVEGVPEGTALVIDDVRTGKLELVDTLARAHQVLLTLSGDDTLREFAFVTRWNTLDADTRRTQYSRYACHELHLFLHAKDPAFFESVVAPYLRHKRVRTFVDRWLLGDDLTEYTSPWAFSRLNTVERVLLARRLPALREAVSRSLADAVDLIPLDPERDARLLDTLLGAARLEGAGIGGDAAAGLLDALSLDEPAPMEAPKRAAPPSQMGRMRKEMASAEECEAPPPPPARAPAPAIAPPAARGPGGDFNRGDVTRDMADRRAAAPLFRSADKTQEWAESDWWHRRVQHTDASLIAPNRFWRDLAAHAAGPFLSPHLGDCAGHAAEALCALAFIDLPFTAGAHATATDDTRLTLTARSHCLAARTRLLDAPAPAGDTTLLVGQRLFRADDRWTWDGAEQREKPVGGELLAGVVYQCQVVVTNPTSARQKLDLLLQIPRGAMPVGRGFLTRTVHLDLSGYATTAVEYAFYFPAAGRFTHFPAHVSRSGEVVASAAGRTLDVVTEPTTLDTASWSHVSQRGSLDDVCDCLSSANLARIDLARIAWRMRDRAAFSRVTALLAARQHYADRLWAWSLHHADRARMAEWLAHQEGFLRSTGPALDGGLVTIDPVARGWYEHLEYAPLINARAHRLGARRKILNDALDQQYKAFLERVAHLPRVRDDDRLAAAHYLFCLDRIDDALAALAKVRRDAVSSPMQHDYLAAYAACCQGDLAAARRHADPWRDHPVDRWRSRFAALHAMLDEAAGERPTGPIDPDSRDQRVASLAAKSPALELTLDHGAVALQHANLDSCQLRFYPMDIELLFSRQPFVQGDVARFAWIDPARQLPVTFGGDGRTTVALPDALAGRNLVVEAVAVGVRAVAVHYAHDLATTVAQGYGQVRVLRASTQAPLPATYVKVYARQRGGAVAFYKDGYTDLCGRFDYVTLSTDDLDRVERFALLVVSDVAGATVLEAPPPPR